MTSAESQRGGYKPWMPTAEAARPIQMADKPDAFVLS
jgi:hypothetical protein